MSTPSSHLLLTGATGFLGGALLRELALGERHDTISVLVRAGKNGTPRQRVEALIEDLFAPDERERALAVIEPLAGDLSEPGLGLDPNDRLRVVESVTEILHAGASTKFTAPLDELRRINVEGTRRLLELAREARARGGFRCYHQVSTAFVAGQQRERATENDLDRGQGFANPYEQTKLEAERLIQEYRAEGPAQVYRPSIIVGHSRSGYTPHFRVLYWPIRILAGGRMPLVPCVPTARLDVVPVDFVVAGIVALMRQPGAPGGTFHLTAGLGQEVILRDLLRAACRHFGLGPRPTVPFWFYRVLKYSPLRFALPAEFWHNAKRARPYLDYLLGRAAPFDQSATGRLLASAGIAPPRFEHYQDAIFEYCRRTEWGTVDRQPAWKYYAERGLALAQVS